MQNLVEKVAVRLLKNLNIPRHIAIIMDGNRRYGKLKNLDPQNSHNLGIPSLKQMLRVFKQLEVKQITIFALAIENFNRDQSEVRALLDLAESQLQALKNDIEQDYKGFQVRFIGNLKRSQLLERPRLLSLINEAQSQSKKANPMHILNVCFSYNSQWEISQVVKNLKQKGLEPTIQNVRNNMLISSPDILVRTSGQHRLSNFMSIQAQGKKALFLDQLWPDSGLSTIAKILLSYNQ